jgi:20S proteasome alpha/beta subunit
MLRDNHLYKKPQNRYLRHAIDYKMAQLAKHDMTYILGARCCDGVVLVGDTKITIEGGTKFTYGKKLFKPFTSVVMGASGISGFYNSFQNRMSVEVGEQERKKINLNDHAKLKTVAENVIREMHDIYEKDRYLLIQNLNVLMAIRVYQVAELTNFSGYGIPEPVNTTKVIGHGEPYGALFLDKIWAKNMTMEQTARLALFIIKLIQDTKIDSSVGYNTEFLPQVYCLPDVIFPSNFSVSFPIKPEEQKVVDESYAKYPIKEMPDDDINHFLNEVGSKVSDFDNLFKQGQFKI